MATVTTTDLIDDLDGAKGASLVTFSVDGHEYHIDLTGANRERLYEALEPFMVAGRKLRQDVKATRNGRQPARTDPAQLAAVRAWASSNGHAVKARGRIPRSVVEAFEVAHQEVTA